MPSAMPVLIDIDVPDAEDVLYRLLERRVPWITHGHPYSQQLYGTAAWPSQGWKLHVSATPLSAPEVLERVLPILLATGVRFKAINSRRRLIGLNTGAFGQTQVGKFITVFPPDAATAVRMAVALDQATGGLPGPRVPTDRPLRPGSLVHYRYGAFRMLREDDARGPYDLLDVGGRLTIDQRAQMYLPPDGRPDPFATAGVVTEPEPRPGPFAGRFLVHELLQRTWRGGVYRAIDLGMQPACLCLLKEFWRDVGTDPYGRDVGAWAENEAALLARLDGGALAPRLYGHLLWDGNHYLSIEYVDGESLALKVPTSAEAAPPVSAPQLMTIARSTAVPVALLHQRGIVHRDVKPGNFIIGSTGRYRLIDFGVAYDLREHPAPPVGMGTPLYVSPQQHGRAADPNPSDDVFGWGAMLHHIAAGDHSVAPGFDGGKELRPFPRVALRELRPDLSEGLAAVIDRALAWERSDRFPSLGEALTALDRLDGEAPRRSRPGRSPARQLAEGTHAAPEAPLELARQIGDALCDLAEERAAGACWPAGAGSPRPGWASPDLYDGTAGVAWVLADLAAATGGSRYSERTRAAARWLAGPAWGEGRAARGLHAGEDGIGLLFLHLAERLGERGYYAAAELRARRSRGVPFQTLDLISGAAGAALFLTRLALATGEKDHLDEAREIADLLVATAQRRPGVGGCYWEVPLPYPGGPTLPYLGLLHGAAGIGLALLSVAEATGEARYAETAEAAGEMLLDQAAGSDATGLRWSRVLSGEPGDLQAHCHGAAGIGQFLLRLWRKGHDGRYARAVRGAAATIEASIRQREASGLCHGVAGDGSFLLDCYQAFGEPGHLTAAQECGRRLPGFAVDGKPGEMRATTATGMQPGLMLGTAGVGVFLLRLARPETAADLILGG
jgi:Lanthionine synthetase C-like protein/Protein kinase domain